MGWKGAWALAALLVAGVLLMAGVSSALADSVSLVAPAATFNVGAAVEDLTPPPDKMAQYIKDQSFHLGGYGLSDGIISAGPLSAPLPCEPNPEGCLTPRFATGVMKLPHVAVRAIVIGDGKRNLAFAELDNQGMFSAYKLNYATGAARPYGIDDIRAKVAADTKGALAFRDITISSDHSHAGQDLTGVWGFVPDDYMQFVEQQAVKALKGALAAMQPAVLKEGATQTPGPCDPKRILSDQFDCQAAPNNVMDSELRTMQALSTSDGHIIATVVNFAAHATVMGGDNTLLSPDWPGLVAQHVQDDYGGVGITLVADVGRSQPNRSDCTKQELQQEAYPIDYTNPLEEAQSCMLSKYASFVMAYVHRSVDAETLVCKGGLDGREFFIQDPVANGAIDVLDYAGDVVGAPIARANTPPYSTAELLGTWVGAFRIGDIVITTNPGEAYPNIRQQFMDVISGARRYWTTGLSNDQLGYLIAPFPEGYPQAIQAGAGGNDNILFNPSLTIGDHVMCTQLKLAAAMGLNGSAPQKCELWAAEQELYIGPAAVTTGPDATAPPPTPLGPPLSGCGSGIAGAAAGPSPATLPNTGAGTHAYLALLAVTALSALSVLLIIWERRRA